MWTLFKIDNFKIIGHRCIIPYVWVAPEQMHNCVIYDIFTLT